jgi:hypothetical protein
MTWNRCIVLVILALIALPIDLSEAQEWDDSLFADLHKEVCQCPDDTWRTIPWKTDLLEAQRLSLAESKPIFIWAMDGHPLGCT